MRAYKAQHVHYCGVDLHARTLFVNVLDLWCVNASRLRCEELQDGHSARPRVFVFIQVVMPIPAPGNHENGVVE